MLDHPSIVVPAFIRDDPEFHLVCRYAAEAHKDQKRKYTYEPYIVHPIEVALEVHSQWCDRSGWLPSPGTPEDAEYRRAIIAALLHDTVEDTGVTFTDISLRFSEQAALDVFWLTDPVSKEKGNRSIRKAASAMFIGQAPRIIQTVKMIDSFVNLRSTKTGSPDFAITYAKEKKMIVTSITKSTVDHPTQRGWVAHASSMGLLINVVDSILKGPRR